MSEWLTRLSLREPLWLLLALLPVIVLAWHKVNYQLPGRLKEFADPHLWRWLITPPGQNKSSVPWLLLAAWLFATLAMSGPYLQQPQTAIQQQRSMDIAVVIDISPSMKARDVFPTRLERAKLEMQDFVANLKGDRTALIAFSANAYNILPLTHDRNTLLHFVKALDVTLTRKRGTNITQALELAQQTLANSSKGSRAIVLISDGESDDIKSAQAAARRLKTDAIPLYILGVGTETGSPIEDDIGRLIRYNGEVVISRLQRANLTTLATISNGAYIDLKEDNSDWQHLFTAMDRLEHNNVYQTPASQPGYPLYPWLLGLSILLFVWGGTRRLDIVAVLLVTPFCFNHEAHATPWQEQRAYDALINKDYGKASIGYEQIHTFNGQIGMGVAAYRLGDWHQALEAFIRADQLATNDSERAKAAYNRGNTLARMGEYDKASAAYEEALGLQTNFPHAALNLSLVNKKRSQAGMKKTDKPEITPDARDTSHDKKATRIDNAVHNDEQILDDNVSKTTDKRVENTDHKELIEQTMAQWNLGSPGTNNTLGSAIWQQRSLDDNPDALLRARITEMDAQHPALAEEKPW